MRTDAPSETTTLAAAVAVALLAGAACSGTDGDESNRCTGPRVLPNQSPFVFGETYPPPGDNSDEEPNPGTFERIPVARTLLLQSKCERKLKIEKSCLIGEEDGDGNDDAEQFSTTGPENAHDDNAAFRITYERSKPNGGGDIDNAAAVFQTNAKNFPTLVVPVCGRVVKEGSQRKGVIECNSPVQAPAKGQEKTGLCN